MSPVTRSQKRKLAELEAEDEFISKLKTAVAKYTTKVNTPQEDDLESEDSRWTDYGLEIENFEPVPIYYPPPTPSPPTSESDYSTTTFWIDLDLNESESDSE